ncbi:myeloid-associated differentiation marker homolog [Pristis pectinata]|uniref:myeloid-associated differentiation marker homolog n=1 Tax=Pristis pectinata TaxID=685728 RepID=UPI00223D640D|nr:myeloid-associated differentiation marker homolog [Pristis pectinata]
MPVRFSDPSDLVSPKAVARLLQILFTCAALGLSKTAGDGAAQGGGFATFAVVAWCFSFTSTLLVFVVEFTQVHSLFPLTWKNLSVAFAAFAGLMNLAASVTYPLLVAVNAGEKPPRCAQPRAWIHPPCAYHAAATVCSSLAFLAYAAEVSMSRSSHRSTYLATGPGLLKVLQVSVACVLSVPLATGTIPTFPVFWWTVAALCACALLSLVAMVMVMECRACCPVPLERLLAAASAVGALLYGAVLVAWTLGLSRQDEPTAGSGATACRWKLCLMSTVLISVNFLAYVADLVYSVKLNCSRN